MDNFPDFKLAIDDPDFFVGRDILLEEVKQNPCKARIILGGRRMGKTSLLNAIQWSLLYSNSNQSNCAFPVLINLQLVQPNNLDNLLYIMICQLIKAMEEWHELPKSSLREDYRSYRRQLVKGTIAIKLPGLEASFEVDNPNRERRLIKEDFKRELLKKLSDLRQNNFNGVCFILDGAEFITRQESWAGDACSYFRGLKDFDRDIRPFFGIILSGYREVKEYQQKIGSKLLNISDVRWLNALSHSEIDRLITQRKQHENIPLSDEGVTLVKELTGGHPYLVQQILSFISDSFRKKTSLKKEELIEDILEHHDNDFSTWWNESHEVGGCGDNEHLTYYALVEKRQGTVKSLSEHTGLKGREVKHALDVLVGTGIIQSLDKGNYKIGARLFEEWVVRQKI